MVEQGPHLETEAFVDLFKKEFQNARQICSCSGASTDVIVYTALCETMTSVLKPEQLPDDADSAIKTIALNLYGNTFFDEYKYPIITSEAFGYWLKDVAEAKGKGEEIPADFKRVVDAVRELGLYQSQ